MFRHFDRLLTTEEGSKCKQSEWVTELTGLYIVSESGVPSLRHHLHATTFRIVAAERLLGVIGVIVVEPGVYPRLGFMRKLVLTG